MVAKPIVVMHCLIVHLPSRARLKSVGRRVPQELSFVHHYFSVRLGLSVRWQNKQ